MSQQARLLPKEVKEQSHALPPIPDKRNKKTGPDGRYLRDPDSSLLISCIIFLHVQLMRKQRIMPSLYTGQLSRPRLYATSSYIAVYRDQ